jgi:hypothetical protein
LVKKSEGKTPRGGVDVTGRIVVVVVIVVVAAAVVTKSEGFLDGL